MRKGWSDKCIRSRSVAGRITAALCAVALAFSSCLLLIPAAERSHAEEAGQNLVVRVQYFGERGDMIREAAVFSRSDLEAMGAQQWYYSNVTNAGTVMSMAAYGPEVMTVIAAAGIDPASIKNVTFRTTDGYTRNFTVEKHLSGGRFYYPHLSSAYERNEDGKRLMPLEGSLADGYEVPAILALEFGSTKEPGAVAENLTMSQKKTYRFCMGETPLAEGMWSRPGETGDVSSLDSVHSIYGIDVTLAGSPVSGIGIDPVGSGLKIGSSLKLEIRIDGDALFAEDYGKALGKLEWSSSDPSIAKVDESGIVTILGEGPVTITVTAENGMSASVELNGIPSDQPGDRNPAAQAGVNPSAANEEKPERESSQTPPTGGQSVTDSQETQTRHAVTSQPRTSTHTTEGTTAQTTRRTLATTLAESKPTVRMRQISLGELVKEQQVQEVRAPDEDTDSLKEQEPYAPGTAAGAASVAIAACGIGGVHRYRRYLTIRRGWKQ